MIFLKSFLWLVLVTSASFGNNTCECNAPGDNTLGLTVFIHGTVGSTFSIFSPLSLSGDTLDESTASARVVNRFRNHESMGYDHISGLEGFHEFEPSVASSIGINAQLNSKQKNASHYLIPAYDDLMLISGIRSDVQKYAIFGWSGLLHNAARKKAGYELYQALSDYRDRMVTEYGIEPEITLVAHSHGGNVALYMAQAEIEQQKHLKINYLVMYGSPMMSEMAHCIESDLFKTIIMLYSKGDNVQPRDMFSSKNRKSYQRMTDIVDSKKFNISHEALEGKLKRYDLCCFVGTNATIITHTNMWLVGRSVPIAQSMNLLPLMVLTPSIIACTQQAADHIQKLFVHAELQIKDCATQFQVCLLSGALKTLIYAPCQELLRERLSFWDAVLLNQWQAQDDTYRHPLFNKKTMQILRSALWG